MPATNEVLQDGRYKLNHQFPVNDDGIVFDAYDTVSDTKVLVKEIVVRMNRVTTPAQQEQLKTAFANQAKVLTSIHHDTLINVHDFFSETNRQFLVMEALEGRELSDLISKEGKGFAVESVVRWADQLLDGLNYLHTFEPSIIHKNIRPDNIKLTADNRVKLLAFGLADGSDTRISTNASTGDDADISYSPLEQAWESLDSASQRVIADSYGEQEEKVLRLPLDESSDIYSLGATLYHLLTGTKPVSALERAIEILDGNADPLPMPSSINPKVPESVSKLVLTAVQVKRSERFRSAAQMRDTLRSVFPLNDFDVKAQSPNTSTEGSRADEKPATPVPTEPLELGPVKATEHGEIEVTGVSTAPAEELAIERHRTCKRSGPGPTRCACDSDSFG
jgi:eukaryotic-like serine/threonine-protein kinase